jgi:rare lipoprotein A
VKRALALALGLALAGCGQRQPAPVPSPHYVVGAPYQAGGTWYYPRESFDYDATGLAVRLPDRTGLTADGEAFDPSAMAGAHQTLQLPAIALVTNLENGRQIQVRLNDRGPADPGRLVGLTRQAADLLGVPADGVAQVRVQVESGPSQALRDRLQGGPKGITAAPVGVVTEEDLPPPGGRQTATRSPMAARKLQETAPAPAETVPDRLPATVEQGIARPGRLWLQAGQFSQSIYANTVKADLSGLPVEIRREGRGRGARFTVMAGPFASVTAADSALDQARAAGVTDAVIVVE